MNRIALFVLLALTGPAWAQTTPVKVLPLYDAFQEICVKANGSAEALEQAVASTKAKRLSPVDLSKRPDVLPKDDVTMWNNESPGHEMFIMELVHKAGVPYAPGDMSLACMLGSKSVDEAGVAAIVGWVGVLPRLADTQSIGSTYVFLFAEQGGKHVLLHAGSPEMAQAVADGHAWLLTAALTKSGSVVVLGHLAAAPK